MKRFGNEETAAEGMHISIVAARNPFEFCASTVQRNSTRQPLQPSATKKIAC